MRCFALAYPFSCLPTTHPNTAPLHKTMAAPDKMETDAPAAAPKTHTPTSDGTFVC